MNITVIRKALDETLREAEIPYEEEDHPWRGEYDEDGNRSDHCTAHDEGQNCCLDPKHDAYDKLLDYLSERVAAKLMYRGGAVTNVVATLGRELQPEPVGDSLRKYEGAVDDERAAVLSFVRRQAEQARFLANDYRVKHADGEARTWSKIAETLGNVANRIERNEHRNGGVSAKYKRIKK